MNTPLTSDDVWVTFLQDGAQPAIRTAEQLAAFLAPATRTLDIAIYDFVLSPAILAVVADALRAAIRRGVSVRLVFEAGHEDPHAGPPPPGSTEECVAELGIDARGIASFRALMHHKYVVRDVGLAGAAVWTGSTNWTDDAWSREENVILETTSKVLAGFYALNFDAIWERGHVVDTVPPDGGHATLSYGGRDVAARVLFAPGQGRTLAHTAAQLITTATRRLRLASPVLTNGAILGALADAVTHDKLDIVGVYDYTQMEQVQRQWSADARTAWKATTWQAIVAHGDLCGKRSIPWEPHTTHDFMHAKILVADDVVLTGSYNLSNNGRENAENVVFLPDAGLADLFTRYVEEVATHYRR